jgi:hypothetical protein
MGRSVCATDERDELRTVSPEIHGVKDITSQGDCWYRGGWVAFGECIEIEDVDFDGKGYLASPLLALYREDKSDQLDSAAVPGIKT